MEFSKLVLSNLVTNKPYAKKVFPYIKPEFFPNYEQSYLFKIIKTYIAKYKGFPTLSTLKIELGNKKDLNESMYKEVDGLIDYLFNSEKDCDDEWLTTTTENWCKERAIYNALLKSIELHEEKKQLESIPEILRKALQVSFDSTCGIEVFDDKSIDERLIAYKQKIKKFPTGIEKLDYITGGGFETKSVSILFGGTGVGKSASLVALSANMARDGEDVLYVTLEMSEEKISQRFEANFLSEKINDIKDIEGASFKRRLNDIKKQSVGRIVIKEYPPTSINIEHIRALLDELEIKKGFKPTVLVIDYVNLMRSARVCGDTLYSTVKAIIEEIRGLAVEKGLCVISATQANKQGNDSKNTDLDITNVSESKAMADTVDLLIALIYPEDLREQNLQIWKVLKNRFGGTVNYKIPVMVEHEKSSIYNADEMCIADNIMTDDGGKREPKTKRQPKKQVDMKFKEDKLDDNLWDD